MNISTVFLGDLKLYLQSRAAQGDGTAQNLLAQLEQMEQEEPIGQALFSSPPGTETLGC